VAGQAHIDRFAHAPFDSGHLRFVKIGRPLLKNTMLSCAATPWRERFSRPRLLYAPTWEGYIAEENYSSLHIAADLLMAAAGIGNMELYVKLHPVTGKVNPQLKNFAGSLQQATGNKVRLGIYDQFQSFHTVLAAANIFVCDVSSVITECLAAHAPIFVYKPHDLGNAAFSGMPLEHFCYVFSDVETFKKKLSSVIQGEDSLAPAREEAIEYYLGRSSMESDHFIKLLSGI
jgi:CDP-glycerol glycerophosphotransferase (TagB/SpsB family)